MIFNEHSDLVGQHAFLSASKSSWLNYDEDKLDRVFTQAMAAARGTALHALANDLIKAGVHLRDEDATLCAYVNDCIADRMIPEQVLYYSENAYGTADAVQFRRNKLRVYDLKTGVTKASVHQLEIYAALFCLEYDVWPFDIEIELRIYQSNKVNIYEADPDEIFHIMDKIQSFDRRIRTMKMEVSS